MRFIRTFVLHLYFDADVPERLCGNIRPLEDPESYPFKSQIEFEAVLRQLIRKPIKTQTTPPEMDSKPDE